MKTRTILAATLLFPLALSAQQVAQPPPITTSTVTSSTLTPATSGTAKKSDDDVVQMSVFEVNSSKDVGYTAGDTTAGARVAVALRDTAAAISPFTQEFLQDVGASTVEDMLAYGANVEAGTGDDDYGFQPDANSLATDNSFRIRGMAMTTAIDGVDSSYNADFYNIDRAEISSGANSILFGTAQPGGMVNLTSASANLQRNTARVNSVLGTWMPNPGNASLGYTRTTLDYNLVLVPRALALRILGMYQHGNNNSWRYWMGSNDKRINPVVTFRPWKNTTIKATFEVGKSRNSLGYAWNASDHVTAWLNANRPMQNTFPPASASTASIPPGTVQINANGNNPYLVLDDSSGIIYDYRMALQTRTSVSNANGGAVNQVRLDESLSSYNYSPTGPGATRNSRFDRYQFTIDQRVGQNLNFQLGYYHNKTNQITYFIPNFDAALYGDPNLYISTFNFTNNGGTLINPNKGRLYMEDNWEMRKNIQRNDLIRLNTEYNLNLQKWGRHRMVLTLEHSTNEIYSDRLAEILVDQNGRGIATGYGNTNPIPGSGVSTNAVIRRHYVTEGDFRTYYDSTWDVPVQPFTVNGYTYHAQYVSKNTSANHVIRTRDAIAITDISYWLGGDLVTTLGGRFDDSYRKREQEAMLTDPNDPRLLSGEKVWRERYFNGVWNTGTRNRPFTYSAGAVWHVTNRFSLHGNFSTNRSADDPNGKSILPDGKDPPVAVGKTTEYGVMFDLFGNGKFYMRLNHFDTRQINAIGVTNQPNYNATSTELGQIYTALHANGLLMNETAPTYVQGLTNAYSRGYELEITANISRGFTMRLAASYTDRAREDLVHEAFDYYNTKIPQWMNLVDPSRNGDKEYYYGGTTLYNWLITQLYAPGASTNTGGTGPSIRDNLSTLMLLQSGGMGTRPIKINLTARYTFAGDTWAWLKGVATTLSVRYQDPNRSPNPLRDTLNATPVTPDDHPMDLRMDPTVYTDYATMIKGHNIFNIDFMIRKKWKLFSRNNFSLQLNVQNLIDRPRFYGAQYRHTTGTTTTYLRRVTLNPPRSVRLTATLDF